MSRTVRPELLAPAGNMQALHAAFKHGADAVYLGARLFGARASVGFDQKDLEEAIRTAHLYGKRVYVTVNTLIKQHEWQDVTKLLEVLDQANVDAVIVQDLGVLSHVRRELPSLPVHASTQMSIHNAAGAELLKEQGVSRVVLARECSLETIQLVAKTGIEVEVFVHGALCVAVSGQCLMSSQIGGRSGNRGRCAQPCRMQYQYRGQQGAWLSPRDLMQLERIPQLVNAGVNSLKIEGRLKSPAYVAAVTQAYRATIDAVLEGRPVTPVVEAHKPTLLQVFNRGGFTEGLGHGRNKSGYINARRVSHEGVPVGTVVKSGVKGKVYFSEVELDTGIHHGDHLQLRGREEHEMIYSGPPAFPGQVVTLRHHRPASTGDTVHRLLDALLEDSLLANTQQRYSPIPISAQLSLQVGQPAVLRLCDDRGNAITVQGAPVQQARSAPITRDTAGAAILKTGESPFVIQEFTFQTDGDGFLPVSALNALRRDALEQLERRRIESWRRPPTPAPSLTKNYEVPKQPSAPALYVRVRTLHHVEMLRAAGMDALIYAPEDYIRPSLADDLAQLRDGDFFCLPRQAEDATLKQLHALVRAANVGVMVENISQLQLEWPQGILAGDGIPAWNVEARKLLQAYGCFGAVLSSEVSREEAEQLMANESIADIVRVYGRVTAMLLNHCPELAFQGITEPQTACHRCDACHGTRGRHLVDSKGAVYPLFPIRLPEGCLNQLMFHTPLHLSRRAFGKRWLLDFTDETPAEMEQLTQYYAALLRAGQAPESLETPYYVGRLTEGVQ